MSRGLIIVMRVKIGKSYVQLRRRKVAVPLQYACSYSQECGNKAVRLATMFNAGLPTKNGVVLTTREVALCLANGEVPQGLVQEICASVQFPVAVRSSAIGEDGELTWAGQFKTVLSVSRATLAEALMDCARAVHSGSVGAYAETHGVALPKLALVVQEMVDAESAGVLFTRHPVSGSDLVIEAVAGLGESLVSGQVEPRRLYVAQVSGDIRAEGATSPDLQAAHIKDLCRLGRLAKTFFGRDQDVEWAIERGTGKTFLLQSRDITALNGAKDESMETLTVNGIGSVLDYEAQRLGSLGVRVSGDVLSDQNIAELLTPHPCQMAFGLFTYIFAHGNGAIRTARNEMGYEIGSELDAGFFHLVGGQPRCSIVHDALTYRIQGVSLEDYSVFVQHYLDRIAADPSLANYPEVLLYNQDPSIEFLTELFGAEKAQQIRKAYDHFFGKFRALEHQLQIPGRAFPGVWENELKPLPFAFELDLAGACAQYRVVADLLRTDACNMFVKVARLGFFAYARLRNLLAELFGDKAQEYADILTSGIPLQDNPNLQFVVALKNRSYALDLKQDFGHLGMHELEISVPRYFENVSGFNDSDAMADMLAGQMTGDPESELVQNELRSLELGRELCAKTGRARWGLERAITMARTYLPLREMVKFEYLKGYRRLRELALRIEQLLQWEPGSIFHLDPREMFLLYRDPKKFAKIAAERRERYEAEKDLFIRPVIFSDRLEEAAVPVVSEDGKTFRGVGVTDGVMDGEVVVVNSFADKEAIAALRPGVILVTVTTDPAWSPMLSIIGRTGGLVTEVGGLLAHGAIYAREMGIAAVLNVPGITKVLRTGMRVRVNGREGCVEVLE